MSKVDSDPDTELILSIVHNSIIRAVVSGKENPDGTIPIEFSDEEYRQMRDANVRRQLRKQIKEHRESRK